MVPDVTLRVCGVLTPHRLLRQEGDCFGCWRLIVEFHWFKCHHHICTLVVHWWVHHVSLGELTAIWRSENAAVTGWGSIPTYIKHPVYVDPIPTSVRRNDFMFCHPKNTVLKFDHVPPNFWVFKISNNKKWETSPPILGSVSVILVVTWHIPQVACCFWHNPKT